MDTDTFREEIMRKRKLRQEVINKVKSSYTLSTRSLSVEDNGIEGPCMYNNGAGRKCAVGMFIKPEYVDDPEWTAEHNEDGAKFLLISNDDILVDEYQGLNREFWEDLQSLHDESVFWDDNGLSRQGNEYVKTIEAKWCS